MGSDDDDDDDDEGWSVVGASSSSSLNSCQTNFWTILKISPPCPFQNVSVLQNQRNISIVIYNELYNVNVALGLSGQAIKVGKSDREDFDIGFCLRPVDDDSWFVI